MSEPLLLGVRDAARRLGIGRDRAYELVRQGRLRSVRVAGRRVLIPAGELTAFVEREAEGGEAVAIRRPTEQDQDGATEGRS